MLRLILLFILFYFVYKAAKVFIKYFSTEVKRPDNIKNNTPNGSNSNESRYKDAEEVEFREIKTDTQNKSE